MTTSRTQRPSRPVVRRRPTATTPPMTVEDQVGMTSIGEALDVLVIAVSQGDEAAFSALYDAVGPRVYGLALRVLRDFHQSEEVTQEVFLQLWQSSARFDPARGSALGFVMMLAHRRAVDRVRASDAARRRDNLHHGWSTHDEVDVTAEAAHASLEARAVRAALAVLTPAQREAIELAYFEGYSYRGVAAVLAIPEGTAKTRIRDGMVRLHDALAFVAPEAS